MKKLPVWLNQEIPNEETFRLTAMLQESGVHTVCQEAHCPNVTHCFRNKLATFMILGKACTRNCSFCAVQKTESGSLFVDSQEPRRIAEVVKTLGLNYVVITSVTRDDLDDRGAGQFARAIESIRAVNRDIKIEVLVPDFQGNVSSLMLVLEARPYVLAHNIETVKRLYGEVRPQADYGRSIRVLSKAKEINCAIITKSSLMLGMGETEEEVIGAMQDLRDHHCDYLTLGQYLAPSDKHYPVKEFIHPEQFEEYRDIGIGLGFKAVFAGPKVRSSYHAQDLSRELRYA